MFNVNRKIDKETLTSKSKSRSWMLFLSPTFSHFQTREYFPIVKCFSRTTGHKQHHVWLLTWMPRSAHTCWPFFSYSQGYGSRHLPKVPSDGTEPKTTWLRCGLVNCTPTPVRYTGIQFVPEGCLQTKTRQFKRMHGELMQGWALSESWTATNSLSCWHSAFVVNHCCLLAGLLLRTPFIIWGWKSVHKSCL